MARSQQSAVSDKKKRRLSQQTPGAHVPRLTQPSAACLLSEAVFELTTHGIVNPHLEAEVLLAHVLGTERAGLYMCLHDPIASRAADTFQRLIQRRVRHEPLQYITGVQEFWSLQFQVDKRVLIPRSETEVVVETALQLLSQSAICKPQSTIRILDAGTGSGCIAIVLAKELPQAELWAIDVSLEALAVARENAQYHGVARRILFLHGDFLAPVRSRAERFDMIVSNPPYIVRDDFAALQPEVRDWEPHSALDGGRDGLDFYRRLLSDGPSVLRSGGWLVMEIGQGQRTAIMRLIQEQPNLTESFSVPDYSGHDRVIVARKV